MIRSAIAGVLTLLAAATASAQQFPTVPAQSVIGRLGVPGDTGPSQAIPFTKLATILGKGTSVTQFGAKCDGASDDTTAINTALALGGWVTLPSGVCKVSTLVINRSGTRLSGAGRFQSTLTSSSTNTSIIQIAALIGNIEIDNLGLTRTVTAAAFGNGIQFLGYVDTSEVHDLYLTKQFVGLVLSSTGFSQAYDIISTNNLNDGIVLQNTVTGGLQWSLFNIFSQANAGRGVAVICNPVLAGISVGEWHNVQTFANSGYGLAFFGAAGCTINGIRINTAFIGGDGNSGIYLDTYAGLHHINNVYVEAEGTGATGPTLTTPASGIGSGVEISANNTDVTVSNLTSIQNSQDGLRTLATQMTNVQGGRFAQNTLYGTRFGDGTKGMVNGASFQGNTSGTTLISANASSIVAHGNTPTTVDNIPLSQIKATTTNDNAAAGQVGEYIEGKKDSGTAVALTTGVAANMTSINLTAGDWDVELLPDFIGGATTTVTYLTASISLTTGALDITNGRFVNLPMQGATVFNNVASGVIGTGGITVRLSLAATTTVFAVAQSAFAVSTCSAYGVLRARRVR